MTLTTVRPAGHMLIAAAGRVARRCSARCPPKRSLYLVDQAIVSVSDAYERSVVTLRYPHRIIIVRHGAMNDPRSVCVCDLFGADA